jgi:hypothetical protein
MKLAFLLVVLLVEANGRLGFAVLNPNLQNELATLLS